MIDGQPSPISHGTAWGGEPHGGNVLVTSAWSPAGTATLLGPSSQICVRAFKRCDVLPACYALRAFDTGAWQAFWQGKCGQPPGLRGLQSGIGAVASYAIPFGYEMSSR